MPGASEGALQYNGKIHRKLNQLGAQPCSTQAKTLSKLLDERSSPTADCRQAKLEANPMHLAGEERACVSQITHRARVTPV